MILVDRRDGSSELATPLKRMGLPVEVTTLPAGDLMWVGRGLKGQAVTVGVEFKTLTDTLTSLRTKRLQGHQLPAMRALQGDGKPAFDFAYLLVEGSVQYDNDGKLVKSSRFRRGRVTPIPGALSADQLLKRLHVLHLCGGLHRIMTQDRRHTLLEIATLYHTWTDTDLDKHKSHLAIYNPEPLVPVSPFVRTIATLPSVGFKVAKAAEGAFASLYAAMQGSVSAWAGLTTTDDKGKTRRFGDAAAVRVVEHIRRVYVDDNDIPF